MNSSLVLPLPQQRGLLAAWPCPRHHVEVELHSRVLSVTCRGENEESSIDEWVKSFVTRYSRDGAMMSHLLCDGLLAVAQTLVEDISVAGAMMSQFRREGSLRVDRTDTRSVVCNNLRKCDWVRPTIDTRRW